MDAHYYNGDDDRDYGDPIPEAPCADCGAREDEPCTAACGCDICFRRGEGQWTPREPDAPTFDEAFGDVCDRDEIARDAWELK